MLPLVPAPAAPVVMPRAPDALPLADLMFTAPLARVADEPDSRFTDLDKDSNGSLSTKELEASEVEGNISDMDINGDEEITRIEYRAYFEKIESE